jgi:M6 family metalloprotease-like protein
MIVARIRCAAIAGLVVLGLAWAPPALRAQGQPVRDWEPRGFDFTPDGVWRTKARAVARARADAIARGDFSSLNRHLSQLSLAAGAPARTTMAVTDTLRIPVLLVRFKDTDTTTLRAASAYDSVLLGTTPPYGRPYTVRTFYTEMSHGLLTVKGVIIGWITLDSANAWYAGPGKCDGLCFSSHMGQLIQRAVMHADSMGIDWGQFDNDGPDGIPNSGDDDGQVDLIWLIQPKPGAECNIDGDIWSHRWYYSGWAGAPITTSSNRFGGGKILVDNYTIQSGVGGITGCDPTTIMAPGTIGHETGHGLGLPDLYDTSQNTEGIGEWGLMGSGNWSRPFSPSHMESFSLARLGWITVQPLTGSGTYHFGPIELGDTAFLVRPTVSNPRGEYFMLENRQAQLADTAMIAKHGGGGLLLWHVDSTQYANNSLPFNSVNSGPIHGVALMQADGLHNLDYTYPDPRNNRGDAGDPYPGSTHNTAFGPRSNPAPVMNNNGAFAGFAVDSITQVAPNGEMSFRLRFGSVTVVWPSDTTAQIRVRGVAYNVYRDLFLGGDTVTVSVDSAQQSADGRTQFLFNAWSDGLARTHLVTMTGAAATFTANLNRRFELSYATAGAGTIAAAPTVPTSAFVASGDSVTLTAAPGPGQSFVGWTGDTTAGAAPLKLRFTHPWSVTANFQATLAVTDSVLSAPVMGAGYADTLRMAGGNGGYLFSVASGTLPPGLTLLANAGVIAGVPTKDSTYTFTVQVTSGLQVVSLPLRLVVTAPALALTDVVNQLLTPTGTLTAAQLKYLDLVGNNNGRFDVGDFVAWLDKTGYAVSAATMLQVQRRAKP